MISPEVPTTPLFHYCDGRAFASIIQSGKMRASHILSLNDFAEGRYGLSIAAEIASTLEHEPKLQSAVTEIVHAADRTMGQTYPFVACFTKESDSLSQWWAYGDDGRGFAIGFEPSSFSDKTGFFLVPKEDHNGIGWQRIVYDKNEQLKSVRELVFTHLGNEITAESKSKFGMRLMFSSLTMKSPAFEVENEWRLLAFRASLTEGTPFRWSQFGLVPYREWPTENRGTIRKVVIGPKNPSNVELVRQALSLNSHPDVDVIRSTATLR